MFKALKRFIKCVFWLGVALAAAFAAWLAAYGWLAMPVAAPLQFSLKHGSSLRSAARQMNEAGVLTTPLQFELLARLSGHAAHVQAGNYEIRGAVNPYKLLQMITSGVHGQDQLTVVEGWTFGQLRAALDAHPALKHETTGVTEAELSTRLGIAEPSPEGWFLPDTYYFPNGASDTALLQRAHRAMQVQLDAM